MTFDRAEYERGVRRDNIGKHTAKLHVLQQAEVPSTLLMGDPSWDVFVQYIQGAIEVSRKQLVELHDAMEHPDLLTGTEMLRVKVDMLRIRERINAWRAVMTLPKEIAATGKLAGDLLARLEKLNSEDLKRGDD